MKPFRLALALAGLVLAGCPEKKLPPPEPSGRCELDLNKLGVFSTVGSGARAKVIEQEDELIGGQFAHGAVGDYLLENDKLRVVIQRPSRFISPIPYGGNIIDADRRRPAGQPGKDQLGKLGLLYAFGRIINVSRVEVLESGEHGGYAVIAATGEDAVNDYLNLQNVIDDYLGAGVQLVVDPNQPLPLYATTYYVLSPGESRVRVVTAFCNRGRENVVMPVGDILEQGGTTDFFNPEGCSNGLGARDCVVDPSPWFGHQGDDVAYAVRGYELSDPTVPEQANALLNVNGVVGTIAGGENQAGMLSYLDPDATRRPGAFGVLSNSSRAYLRDLYVTRDLGEVTSLMGLQEGGSRARLSVTVALSGGAPAAGARVAVVSASSGKQLTLLVADGSGKAKVDLPTGGYKLIAGMLGAAVEPAVDVQVPSSGTVEAALKVGPSRRLTVSVADASGAPLPAKVLVVCPGGPCATRSSAYAQLYDVEPLPSNVAAVGLVPPQGSVELLVPPGQYELFVTRGPEYSAWPDTFPARGEPLDLTATDGQRAAVLARVVDTTGWMSADLHVHAVNSPDSSVPNDERALIFLAEGVDVLVSTDHDFITDYAPTVQALGASHLIATLVGVEVTPFDFGHQQAYPVSVGEGPNGGAFDWAGGDGPTLRPAQLYAGLRERWPDVVIQMNHPRGKSGSLTQLKVDTATGASHQDPALLRMEPSPDATGSDTRLFSHDFDAIEVQNGVSASTAVLNDWMTFLSRGAIKTGTAGSDTHSRHLAAGGYSRTYVQLGVDEPARFDPAKLTEAMKARRAIGTNGPFVRLAARRLDSAGQPLGSAVGVGGTLSVDLAAGEKVELEVEVQAPEWLTFDTIEVLTHADGREALNGEPNTTWPSSRIHQSRSLDPTALPVVPVPGTNSRRIQVVEKFTVSPAADTWYLVIVRGSSQSASLFPLTWRSVSCTDGLCTPSSAHVSAFTNAILIDADGSGAYDDFPLAASQRLTAPPPRPAAVQRRVPTMEELSAALRELLRPCTDHE